MTKKKKTLKETFLREEEDSLYFTEEQRKEISSIYQDMRDRLNSLDEMLSSEQSWIEDEGSAPYFREPGGFKRELESLDYLEDLYRKASNAIKEAMKSPEEKAQDTDLARRNLDFQISLSGRKK